MVSDAMYEVPESSGLWFHMERAQHSNPLASDIRPWLFLDVKPFAI
jgi:hypothetical protein